MNPFKQVVNTYQNSDQTRYFKLVVVIINGILWHLKNGVISSLSFIVLIAGIGVALYISGWVLFIGGIVDLINLLKSSIPLLSAEVGIAVLMIVSSLPMFFVLLFMAIRIWEPIDHLGDSELSDPWREYQWVDGNFVENPYHREVDIFFRHLRNLFFATLLAFWLAFIYFRRQ